MILLSITMFVLGVLAFTDAIFNYGNMFRMLFSALLIFMSVWVYLKTKDLGDLERIEIVSASNFKSEDDDGNSEIELTQRMETKDNKQKQPEKVSQ